ncbi:hypothetical protein F5J12DRAFT_949662 [Pisolithus orientalis]|uniref:uncharacterized protein n=1 Tax=Pisolithus orientalis TaxID=936130 RepID=UPI002224AC25|nr:uncharacterized protein F5J12DRAFT_949662 [Pisolithus orientalis]KAI6001678.1 hypothetical protein F5J12DRAFT_949662 [Pisolithus orientalis]
MSSPFSVTSSPGGNNNAVPPRFAVPYSYNMAPVHHQQRQRFYHHTSMLPPGKNDLEALESLKTMIKDGQHEFYRAYPQPAALASLYLGPPTGLSQAPPHPEQMPGEYRTPHLSRPGHDDSFDNNNLSSDVPSKTSAETHSECLNDNVHPRHCRLPSLAKPDTDNFQNIETPSLISAGPKQHEATSVSGNGDSSSTVDIKPTAAQSEEDGPHDVGDASGGPANSTDDGKNDGLPSVIEREGEYSAERPRDTSPSKSACDTNDDSKLPRENSWSRPDASPDDRRTRQDDRQAYPPTRSAFEPRGSGNDSRIPSGNKVPFDRDRDREHDHDRGRDWERDRERPRDRRPDFHFRSYGRSHAPRPPPELRHYEPNYSSDYLPRRYDSRDMDLDRRGGHRNGSYDDRKPPLDDRRFSTDERPSRAFLPCSPDHRNRGRSLDDRPITPPDDTVPAPRPGLDDRSRLPTDEDRGSRVPPPPEQRPTRPPVPLEERISQSVPSLQDRLSQPVLARVDNLTGRQPSLEERLSLAPLPTATASSVTAPATVATERSLSDDRGGRSGTIDTSRTTMLNDRPTDTRSAANGMFSRPATPPVSRTTSYVPPARATSVARDDHRMLPPTSKDSIPPVDRSNVRDFRASRDLSRERPAPPYRSDVERSFGDNRDRTIIDVDAPIRFPDTRGPPLRRLTPPPRPSDRARAYYPPRSPSRDTFDAGERRYAPADRDAFDRRRDWYAPPSTGAGTDDEKRPMWRYDRAPADRDHRDRIDHWDEREDEREREKEWERRRRERERERDRGFPSPPQPRSLSSRLTDPYPPAGVDHRTYPPHCFRKGLREVPVHEWRYFTILCRACELGAQVHPVVLGGVGGAGGEAGVPYASSTTYPSSRRPSGTGEYGARSAVDTPPPSSSATGIFYDSRGPPPFSSSSVTGDREYGNGSVYGSTYEREVRRTPPPSSRIPPPHEVTTTITTIADVEEEVEEGGLIVAPTPEGELMKTTRMQATS